ncbi:MAG TPA: S1/P1 nuclease [Steroidobacteraceae bacterium]|nr:S1/P1 nuclease [Steroidobacteraceae bacterium]
MAAALLCLGAAQAWGWSDEGHEVVALIAERYLEPAVRTRVQALLDEDDSGLVARDIADEATWADRYRDSDRATTRMRYHGTREWHFVDLEIDGPDLNRACHGRRPLPAGIPASRGPADDCIVDKIDQFQAELSSPATAERERRLALQFLLHLVGDLHQPLHASDDHDQGANRKQVSGPGLAEGSLHRAWDGEFVARLGPGPDEIARRLAGRITAAERAQWSRGTPADWALETYAVSRAYAYGPLPAASGAALYLLTGEYIDQATGVSAEQLAKAGVRLAFLLNQALGR